MRQEEIDDLIDAIATQLPTWGMRYMFLKVTFPKIIHHIQLEGTPIDTAYNIYEEFRKRGMIGSLMAVMNTTFELNLMLTYSKQ